MLAERTGLGSSTAQVALRPASLVMRLKRLGSLFPSRLSFIPTLLRRLGRERWTISCREHALDATGTGHAVYVAKGPERSYSLVAFSQELEPERRTDRVIAEAWDATFVLFDGVPTAADIDRLRRNAPRQEAGRYLSSELVLARANRSVRLFDHVVETLAGGRQPAADLLAEVGYLMRTTAVYGNGKFGIADRSKIAGRPEMAGPFQAEMLAVYLIRCFTLDLVEHVAQARAPGTAVPLAPALKRLLGIGNSTGLGMAPFLVSHPVLINNWIAARETALARARGIAQPDEAMRARFAASLAAARRHVGEWRVADPTQSARIERLADDLVRLDQEFRATCDHDGELIWDGLYRWAEDHLSVEGQELLVSLLIGLEPALVDDLVAGMASVTRERLEPGMTAGALRKIVETSYDWALALDLDAPDAQKLFWYVSEEKLEPRLGERGSEPGSEREMPLAIARDVQALHAALCGCPAETSAARLSVLRPELRHVIERVQTVGRNEYAEIRDSLIDATCLPIDLLRCKLSFFGASKFDPKSDRWTRITMFAGAPLPEELADGSEAWSPLFPTVPTA